MNVTRQPQNKKDTTVLQKTYHRCSFLWLVVLYSRTTTDMSFVLPWNIRPLLLSCEKVLFVDVDQFETRSVACYTLINQLIKIISTHASLPKGWLLVIIFYKTQRSNLTFKANIAIILWGKPTSTYFCLWFMLILNFVAY